MMRRRGPTAPVLELLVLLFLFAFFLAFIVLVNASKGDELHFTLPATGQHRWITQVDGEPELNVECAGTDSIHELQMVYLWGQPVTGGGFAVVDSHSVVGMEGRAHSFTTPFPGNFYVDTRNTVGRACASGIVTILPPILTGVPTEDPAAAQVLVCMLYDVRGRRVATFPGSVWNERIIRGSSLPAKVRLPSGVYFLRGLTATGALLTRRVVVLR